MQSYPLESVGPTQATPVDDVARITTRADAEPTTSDATTATGADVGSKTGDLSKAPEPEVLAPRSQDTAELETGSRRGRSPLIERLRAGSDETEPSRWSKNARGNKHGSERGLRLGHADGRTGPGKALEPFMAASSGKHPGGLSTELDSDIVSGVALHGRGVRSGESIDLTLSSQDGVLSLNGVEVEQHGDWLAAEVDGIAIALRLSDLVSIEDGTSLELGRIGKFEPGSDDDAADPEIIPETSDDELIGVAEPTAGAAEAESTGSSGEIDPLEPAPILPSLRIDLEA